MSVAEFPVANYPVAYSERPVRLDTAVDVIATRKSKLRLPWPLLRFWDIYLGSVGGWKYFVDFAHPDCAGATPDTVSFNSHDYQTIKLAADPIVQSIDGTINRINLTILDPHHTIVGYLRDYDAMRGQPVKISEIWYDYLDTPTLANTMTTYVRSAMIREGPDAVTLELGSPNFFNMGFPRRKYNRRLCHNFFARRFYPDNNCRYPSDEFEGATKQWFDDAAGTEQEKRHGWFVLNGDNVDLWLSGSEITEVSSADLGMRIDITTNDVRWDDTTTEGPFAYKKISGDFDAYTKVTDLTGTRAQWYYNILCQSTTDLTDWLAWGWHEDTGAIVYQERKTVNGVSTDTNRGTNPPYHTAFRMKRSGTTFTLYSCYLDITLWEDENPDDSDWTQQASFTLDLGTDVRLGVMAGSDVLSSATIYPVFFYFRFLEGGEAECSRSSARCTQLDNDYQFNGFLGMPDNLSLRMR